MAIMAAFIFVLAATLAPAAYGIRTLETDIVNPEGKSLRAGLAQQVKGRVVTHDDSVRNALQMRVRRGVEILEAWQDSGKAIAGKLTESELTSRVSSITADRFHKAQSDFVGLTPSRFILSPGNKKAALNIQTRLAQLGFTVEDQAVHFDASPYASGRWTGAAAPSTGNIIGVWKGTDLAQELVVFGAHYDSVNWRNTSDSAPGADDNGSGESALLILAEAVAAEAKVRPLRRSVALVSFQAEEVGLVGSKQFVSEVVQSGKYGKPVAVVIADEVSHSGRDQFARKAIFETKGRLPANVALVDTMAHAASAEKDLAGFEINYDGFGSDHIPFLDAGYPAVLLIERDNMYFADTWGHSAEDTMDKTDAGFGAAMTRLAARTVLTFASPA